MNCWENVDRHRRDGTAHYSVLCLRRERGVSGMDALRAMFPNGEADDMNAVLFSTSGIHGTYSTIEEAEAWVLRGERDEYGDEGPDDVTFLIVQPRIVCLRYGVCEPKTAEDFAFLRKLRTSSHGALASIGAQRTATGAASPEVLPVSSEPNEQDQQMNKTLPSRSQGQP